MKTHKILVPLSFVLLLVLVGLWIGPGITSRFAYAVEKGQIDAARAQLAELSKQDTLSPLFRAVSKACLPAVVEVKITKKISMRQPPGMGEFFRHFFGDEGPETPQLTPRRQPQQRGREFLPAAWAAGCSRCLWSG